MDKANQDMITILNNIYFDQQGTIHCNLHDGVSCALGRNCTHRCDCILSAIKGVSSLAKAQDIEIQHKDKDIFELVNSDKGKLKAKLDKVKDLTQTGFRAFFEGDAEFPDDATYMKLVKYVEVDKLEQALKD